MDNAMMAAKPRFTDRLQESWYAPANQRFRRLASLSWLYKIISQWRKKAYQMGLFYQWKPAVPVVIVGNITVGGSGKTPIVIALVEKLKSAGYKPGVVSRGYGGRSPTYPVDVKASTSPLVSGDEPALIAQRCSIPVVVDPDRVAAAQYLMAHHDCNIIISDDGLQHYALGRDIEIVVVDGERGLGNQYLLPMGPLRESPNRLYSVDFVLVNGPSQPAGILPIAECFSLIPQGFVSVTTRKDTVLRRDQQKIVALAGIGNPDRFFTSLTKQGFCFERRAFPDHHQYAVAEISSIDADIILMTEKDAVKCHSFLDERLYFQPVNAQLSDQFYEAFLQRVSQSIAKS